MKGKNRAEPQKKKKCVSCQQLDLGCTGIWTQPKCSHSLRQ